MKEDSELYFGEDENLREIVRRYEAMVKSNRIAYFDVHEYERMVDHYIMLNQSDDAINVLRIAKKQHPNSSELTIKQAEIDFFSGHFKDALDDLTSVENIEKDNPDLYLIKGKTYLATSQKQEALAMFDLCIDKCAENKVDIIFEVVTSLEEYDEFEVASRYLQKAVKIEPDNCQIYGELGFILEHLNRTEDAITAYETMVDLDPFLAFGWSNIGVLYSKLGNNAKAIEAFDYVIALEPETAIAYYNKANALANNGDINEALSIFLEYLKMDDDSAMALCCIAECYEKLGDFDNAGRYYRQTLDVEPNNPDALYGLAVVELENDNVDESFSLAQKALEIDPNIPEYWFGYGKLNLRLGNLDTARSAFEKAISLDPLDFESWLLLSEIEENDSIAQAIAIVQRGLKENGEIASLHYRLAAYSFLMGDMDQSAKAFERGLELDIDSVEDFFEFCPEATNEVCFLNLLKSYLQKLNPSS